MTKQDIKRVSLFIVKYSASVKCFVFDIKSSSDQC